MSEENGGPAFPMAANEYSGTGPEWGMTLRDYFAATALNSLVNSSKPGGWNVGPTGSDNAWLAAASYAFADAMLAERNRELAK